MRPARDLPAAPAYLLLALALGLHFNRLAPLLPLHLHEFDAVHLYLPAARELLAQGPAFFLQERSIHSPPLAYAWPMLVGASVERFELANAVLSGIVLLLVFRCAQLMHSRIAGVAAALLFATNPLMPPFFAAPVTEAPFIFWCAAWLWGMCEWIRDRRAWALALAAVGICCAALTRAPMFYGMVLLFVLTTAIAWRVRARPGPRAVAMPMAVAFGLALLPPLAFIAKNLVVFGFPFYATGAGNQLYLGNNPLTGGYDPTYLGLIFDVGAIARDMSPLTLEAERLLRGAARVIFADKDAAFFASLHAKKLLAFVFVTNAEPGALALRTWRIALMVLGGLGLAAIADRRLRWALAGMFLFLVAIHVPVHYTHRFSVSSMDLWLVVAAGVGLASLVEASWPRRWVALGLVAAGIAAGFLAYDKGGRPMADVFAAGRLEVWESGPLRGAGASEVAVENTKWFRGFNQHVLVLEVSAGSCKRLRVSYRPRGGGDWFAAPAMPVPSHGRVQLGSSWLRLEGEGLLRIACDVPGTLALDRAAVYASLGAIDYRERFLGEKPLLPVER